MTIKGTYTNDQRVNVTWDPGDDIGKVNEVAARVAAEHDHKLTGASVRGDSLATWATEPAGPSA